MNTVGFPREITTVIFGFRICSCLIEEVVAVNEDDIVVFPKEFHRPSGTLDDHNDHRVVMALAILCTIFGGEIEGAEAVNKSFPEEEVGEGYGKVNADIFIDDRNLGGLPDWGNIYRMIKEKKTRLNRQPCILWPRRSAI